MLPAELVGAWRKEAAVLRKRHDERGATLLEQNADELELAIAAHLDEPITAAQAQAEGLCSDEAVYRALKEGRAENVGTPTRPMVRRGQVPRGRKGRPASFGSATIRAAETALERRGL